jgi:hypothetical protein
MAEDSRSAIAHGEYPHRAEKIGECSVCAAMTDTDSAYCQHLFADHGRRDLNGEAIADAFGFCAAHAALLAERSDVPSAAVQKTSSQGAHPSSAERRYFMSAGTATIPTTDTGLRSTFSRSGRCIWSGSAKDPRRKTDRLPAVCHRADPVVATDRQEPQFGRRCGIDRRIAQRTSRARCKSMAFYALSTGTQRTTGRLGLR